MLQKEKNVEVENQKLKNKKMSKYNLIDIYEQYQIGSGWTTDFDYDGMLKYALKVNHKTPLKTLQKLHDSATDVNYHTPFSGLGNAINPLNSITNKKVYGIPMILLIGWRGEIIKKNLQVHDEPQHLYQGKITLRQLELIDIPYKIISKNLNNIEKVQKRALRIIAYSNILSYLDHLNFFRLESLNERRNTQLHTYMSAMSAISAYRVLTIS